MKSCFRKWVLGIIAAAFIAAPVFGEEAEKNAEQAANAVFADLSYTLLGALSGGGGLGVVYERMISEHISALAGVNFLLTEKQNFSMFEFGGSLQARYYPSGSAISQFFIALTAEYQSFKIGFQGKDYKSDVFSVSPMAGWKKIFGNKGFFVEPALGFAFRFGEINMPNDIYIPLKSGLVFALGMGAAF